MASHIYRRVNRRLPLADPAALLSGLAFIVAALLLTRLPAQLADFRYPVTTDIELTEPVGDQYLPYAFVHYWNLPSPDSRWFFPVVSLFAIYWAGGLLATRLGTNYSRARAAAAGALATPVTFAYAWYSLSWQALLPTAWTVLALLTLAGGLVGLLGGVTARAAGRRLTPD